MTANFQLTMFANKNQRFTPCFRITTHLA